MAQAEEIRFKEFRERFATEDACRAELFRLRSGVLPHQGSEHLPVPLLPPSDLRHCRNGHAPHPSSPDCLVLGHLDRGH